MGVPANDDMHANYVHALRQVARIAPGAVSKDIGPWFVHDAAVDNPVFNIAVVRHAREDPLAYLAAVETWFGARGLDFRFALRTDTDSAVLAAALERGYAEWWREPAMLLWPLPLAWPMPPELEVHRVRPGKLLALYEQVEATGDPDSVSPLARAVLSTRGCSLWVGLVGGQPVARAMAVVHAGLVGVNNVYVDTAWRRRGYGAAITAAAISFGHSRGAAGASLEATELGYPVYARMGFQTRYELVAAGPRGLSVSGPA